MVGAVSKGARAVIAELLTRKGPALSGAFHFKGWKGLHLLPESANQRQQLRGGFSEMLLHFPLRNPRKQKGQLVRAGLSA